MNWFDHLRGYDEGMADNSRVKRHKHAGILTSLLSLIITLFILFILSCIYLLNILEKLLSALLRLVKQ